MNILVVHEKNWRVKNVFELQSYAESLSLKGHNVFAVEYDEVWEREHLFDFGHLTSKRFENVARSFENAAVTLIRPGMIKLPVISRLSSGLTFLSTVQNLIANEHIDVIWMYCVPTFGLQTIYLARKNRIPVLFRAIDIPTELVPNPVLRTPTYLLEKLIYPRVDKVLALTPKLKDYVIDFGVREEQVELLLPSVRTDLFRSEDPNPALMKEWGIEESDQVVLYMGRMYTFSGLDSLIDNFGRVLAQIPNAKLLLVGHGEELSNLQRQAQNVTYSNRIIFTDYQPFDLMPKFINLSRVCTIPFQICDATDTIIPSKVLEYLACGVPVVSTPLPGTMDILSGENAGVLYAKDEFEFVQHITLALTDDSVHKTLTESAVACIQNQFSWSATIEQLEGYFMKTIHQATSKSYAN